MYGINMRCISLCTAWVYGKLSLFVGLNSCGTQVCEEKEERKKKKKHKENSRQSVRWSAVPVPCPRMVVITVEGGSRAAAPEGSMTYAFTHMRNFLLLIAIGIWALGLGYRPWG